MANKKTKIIEVVDSLDMEYLCAAARSSGRFYTVDFFKVSTGTLRTINGRGRFKYEKKTSINRPLPRGHIAIKERGIGIRSYLANRVTRLACDNKIYITKDYR